MKRKCKRRTEKSLRGIQRRNCMSFFVKKKWRMHLYLNGIYVGKVRINENDEPSKNVYLAHFWFKPQIFHSLHVKSLIHPLNVLYTDEKRKITHWTFEYEKGEKV